MSVVMMRSRTDHMATRCRKSFVRLTVFVLRRRDEQRSRSTMTQAEPAGWCGRWMANCRGAAVRPAPVRVRTNALVPRTRWFTTDYDDQRRGRGIRRGRRSTRRRNAAVDGAISRGRTTAYGLFVVRPRLAAPPSRPAWQADRVERLTSGLRVVEDCLCVLCDFCVHCCRLWY